MSLYNGNNEIARLPASVKRHRHSIQRPCRPTKTLYKFWQVNRNFKTYSWTPSSRTHQAYPSVFFTFPNALFLIQFLASPHWHIGFCSDIPIAIGTNIPAKANEPILPTHRIDFRKQILFLKSNEIIDTHISDLCSVPCCQAGNWFVFIAGRHRTNLLWRTMHPDFRQWPFTRPK